MMGVAVFSPFLFLRTPPPPAGARHFRAVREIDRVVYGLIARGREKLKSSDGRDPNAGRQTAGGAKDLLTLLLTARAAAGNSMSDQQLRAQTIHRPRPRHATTPLLLH